MQFVNNDCDKLLRNVYRFLGLLHALVFSLLRVRVFRTTVLVEPGLAGPGGGGELAEGLMV